MLTPTASTRRRSFFLSALAILAALIVGSPAVAREIAVDPMEGSEIVVFLAKKVVTMEPGQPEATAIAVRDGLIVDVGSLKQFEPWIRDLPHRVDRRFARKVLMPGFIDPHVHPFLAGKLLTFDIAAPEAWNLPSGRVASVTTREAFIARLTSLSKDWTATDRPQIIWGWHRLWHGEFTRADLDQIAPNKPLLIWHRSYHEIVANSKAIDLIDLTEGDLERFGDQINLEQGHFFELGMGAANRALAPLVETPEKIADGLEVFTALMQRGGITTAADMIAGSTIGIDIEWEASKRHLQGENVPYRTLFIHAPFAWKIELGDGAHARLLKFQGEANDQLRWPKAIKTASDGAFISQLMRMGPPGYLDGHKGEWMVPPKFQRPAIESYWKDGWDIYYHVNGDEGLDVVLDTLEGLKRDYPRVDYRFSLEHFGLSREDQVQRFAALGGSVSTNGYYLHYFGQKYTENGIGYARASQMTRHGSVKRAGLRLAMHSDCPMGPLEPLLAVTTAVTRRTQSGEILAPEQAISVDDALRAVTIDAAWNLRLDDEVGSIAPGKRADFVVLEKNPYDVRPSKIRDIGVWGTVYEGRVFEAP